LPLPRPTLATLIDQAQADFNAAIAGADSRLRFGFLDTMARVEAASIHALYGWLQWLVLQAFVTTAEAEYLDQEADDLGLTRQPATTATGSMTATGSSGSAIPVNSRLQRADGVQYRVTASTAISAGTASVALVCLTPGKAGNAPANSQLTFVQALPGVQSQATSGVLAGGADVETDDRLRDRVLLRKRQPPQGGAKGDYGQWCQRLPGLTRSWPSPNEAGLNTLTIHFMMDDTYPDGIPTTGDAANLLAILEPLRPITLELFCQPPTAQPLNVTIDLIPDTPEVRDAVEVQLKDLIRRDAQPGGALLISRLREAVSIATGETDNQIVSPTANVLATSPGHIHTMGTITWL
jgi:uncharacterized phage protein gp47/JayE